MMFEVKAIDGVLGVQPRKAEAALDGAAVANFQFQVDQRLQGMHEAEILSRGVSRHLIQLAAHGRQAELNQFLVKCDHKAPFGNEE